MSWPILYSQVLKINDPDNSVGIATMWTEREIVGDLLKDKDYCVIGNLYSAAGISAIIRNIFAKPTIRNIVLWGADLSASGQSFVNFMQNGVDRNYKIIGDKKCGEIESEIDRQSLELFRKSINVVNLRGKPVPKFKKTVEKLSKKKEKPFTKPKIFPQTKPKVQTFPSEQIGMRVHGRTVAQTWLKVLLNIMRYGREKKTRYAKCNELRELLNIIAVVYSEDINKPYLARYFPFTKVDLAKYCPQVLSAKIIPGVSYTYGQRLRDHDGVDQIKEIIKLIKRRPFSKKQVAFTANIKRDWAKGNIDRGDTPCLTQVLTSIQDGKIFMTTHFRSQDMVHGWPRNVFSLMKLQQMICDQTGYERGPFCMITHSAHIYADDYQLVENILDEYYKKELGFLPQQHFEEDPRGNVIVSVEARKKLSLETAKKRERQKKDALPPVKYEPGVGKIIARLYAPSGGLMLKEWEAKKSMELYMQITDWDYLVMPSHLVYVGTELQKAEFALKFGFEYSQDPAAHKEL